MDAQPDIAAVAALLGEPARARCMLALLDGKALTATELAAHAGVTKQTASAHLAKLVDAQLLIGDRQGRHRYFRLAGADVAALLEHLLGVATRLDAGVRRTGPADTALREARTCYDHLAGSQAVRMFDHFIACGFLHRDGERLDTTPEGEHFFSGLGLELAALQRQRRAYCAACLDWSERRHHLSGALGAALLDRFLAEGWMRRKRGSRAILFTAEGERLFRERILHAPR